MPEQVSPAIQALKEWGDNAYLAGIIDGEGSVQLIYSDRGWRASIDVSLTCLPVIRWIKENYGGSVYTYKVRGNHKPLWRWSVAAKEDILNVINKVLLFLMIKQEKALLLKEYCIGIKGRHSRISKKEHERRMGIYYAMKGLNYS